MSLRKQRYRLLKRKLAENRDCVSEVYALGTAASWASLPPLKSLSSSPSSSTAYPGVVRTLTARPAVECNSGYSDNDSDVCLAAAGFKAIRRWAVQHGISKAATNDLLRMVIKMDHDYINKQDSYEELLAGLYTRRKTYATVATQTDYKTHSLYDQLILDSETLDDDLNLKTMDDYNNIIARMKERRFRDELKIIFKEAAGFRKAQKIAQILEWFSPELLNQFNWSGTHNKKPINGDEVFNLIYASWKSPEFTNDDFCDIIRAVGNKVRSKRCYQKAKNDN